MNNAGGGGVPGLEEVWDDILTSGEDIYGIAADDVHVFKRPWDTAAARPGQGWVVVRSAALDARAVVSRSIAASSTRRTAWCWTMSR